VHHCLEETFAHKKVVELRKSKKHVKFVIERGPPLLSGGFLYLPFKTLTCTEKYDFESITVTYFEAEHGRSLSKDHLDKIKRWFLQYGNAGENTDGTNCVIAAINEGFFCVFIMFDFDRFFGMEMFDFDRFLRGKCLILVIFEMKMFDFDTFLGEKMFDFGRFLK